MEIFGIADLHLGHAVDKPMDIFGDHWRDHARRMAEAWDAAVGPADLVLCPGDLSWAMRLDDAAADLAWIGQRPGVKVLGRGNHDYWWSSLAKVRAALPAGCQVVQNDATVVGEVVVAGTRLWAQPGSSEFGPGDDKILRRELLRLELSLGRATQLAEGRRPIIAALHYPPFAVDGSATEVTALLERHGVALCVYGHLHGSRSHRTAVEGQVGPVCYRLIAADYLGFAPRRLTGDLPGGAP